MTIYRVPSTNPYQRPFRVFGWGAIVLLLSICLFSIYEPQGISDWTNKVVAFGAGAIVVMAIVAALLLSEKVGMWKIKSTSQWELDEVKILRRGNDGRTAEIPLIDIKSLSENRGWLLIWGGEPPRQIAIPSEVNGFDDLKGKLSVHREISALKRHPFWAVKFVPFVLGIIAYGFLFLSRNRAAIMASCAVAILLQFLATYSIWHLWRKNSKPMPKPIIVSLAVAFLIVAWIVYQQTRTLF